MALKNLFQTSVGRKYVSALTGLALVLFVIVHLLGNLTLFVPGSEAFNGYAAKLDALGPLKYAAEIGLVAFFGLHAIQGMRLALQNRAARGSVGYRAQRTKGRPSRWNIASIRMPITGLVILAFVVLHLIHFRFGPGEAQGYTAIVGGHDVRDLHRLVVETFSRPWVIAAYAGSAALLGLHLRHGIWSAFQSLGQMNRRATWTVYTLAAVIAAALALGFIALPFYLYFTQAGA